MYDYLKKRKGKQQDYKLPMKSIINQNYIRFYTLEKINEIFCNFNFNFFFFFLAGSVTFSGPIQFKIESEKLAKQLL